MKRMIALMLATVLFATTFHCVDIHAQDVEKEGSLFEVDYHHVSTTTITGDEVNGYRYTTSGEGRHRILYKEGMPITDVSVDFGHNYEGNLYGEIGVSLSADVDNTENGYSDENVLTFHIRSDNGTLYVSVVVENLVEKQIAVLTESTHRKDDGYWRPNVSNYAFVEMEGHWHLAIDGVPCNNVAENFEYSCLERILGDAFQKQVLVYPYFGGYSKGNGFFKPMSVSSADGIWSSYAVDSYKFYMGSECYEYRGQGLNYQTDSRAAFEYSAIPKAAEEDGDGHIVDFTGTDGYAQTNYGYDLKTTTFYVSPITYQGNENRIYYELGFTTNPTAPQHHNKKSEGTKEIQFVSIYNENRTAGFVITNTDRKALPTTLDLGRIPCWKTHRYENDYKTAPIEIKFVQENGADGNPHWYMKTTDFGTTTVAKSDNVETDKYLQFDDIIEQPVYFRMGPSGKATDDFKMYCRIQRQTLKTDEVYHNLSLGDYEVEQSGFQIDGTRYAIGETLDTVGSYDAEYIDGKNLYQGTVKLYRYGDVNSDNDVDVCDWLAMVKASSGKKNLSTEGKLSADFDANNVVDSSDIQELKNRLLRYDEDPDEKTYYLKDFGAVGDGVTNDVDKISRAIDAVNVAQSHARLIFEADKTYYCKNSEGYDRAIIQLENCSHVQIEGNQAKIVAEAPLSFIYTNGTTDCSVSGLRLTYGVRPYFMAEEATEINTSTEPWSCVMKIGEGMAEKYLGLTEIGQCVEVKVNGNNSNAFGIMESETGRPYLFLDKYELVGKDKIKIYFNKDASSNTKVRMNQLDEQRLICPTPNVGHMVEHAVSLRGDTNLTMQDIDMYSSCKFAVELVNSEGVIQFEDFNIIPDPDLKGTNEETDFTSWRDGWHLKENRAKVVWRNCEATGLQDDIFNISSSIMWIKEVLSDNQINMYWDETGGPFRAELKKGDKVTILNVETGEIIATTSISRLIRSAGSDNIVELEDAINNLPSGENIKVVFESLVAPGSVIENCSFNGTYRFRGPITVSDTTFVTKRLWLDVLNENWLEGPIPKNMLFKNCTFVFESSNSTYVHASAYNKNTSDSAYHLENIVFDNCMIDQSCFDIGTGDTVTFKNCRTQ